MQGGFSHHRRLWILGFVAVLVAIVLFSSSLFRLFAFFQRPLVSFGSRFASAWQISTSSQTEQEAQTAEQIMQRLAIERAELEQLRRENEDLKKQLGFFGRQPLQHVTAAVLQRSLTPLSSTFLIDRGSEEGVRRDAPVIMGEGFLIGKVSRVYAHQAVVRALTDRETKMAVSILNHSRTIGLVEGTSGALLSLLFVPQEERLQEGDLVMTSGLESLTPPGLLIGTIQEVIHDPTAAFQQATIKPLVDERRIELVSVLLLEDLL